ncbi:recombinase family protein, partial [Acetobacter farinalis]
MKRYGYARVSTEGQTNDAQILSLLREGLSDDMITKDIISGGVPALSRPGMSSLLKTLEAGDSLVAAKLDRLGRDTVDVIGLIRILNGLVTVLCRSSERFKLVSGDRRNHETYGRFQARGRED